jgi:GTP-binding protein EngB required for normal cell division
MAIAHLDKPNLLAIVTGDNSPFLNVVIDTRSPKKNSSEYVTEFSDFFKQHNVPWSWMVTKSDQNNDLDK